MPYVYLLQPAEFINTNCYKIGMSSLEDLSRLKSYGHGTKCIQCFECINYKEAEKELLKELNEDTTINLFKGREYFCGALKNIKKVFIKVMNKYVEMELELDNTEDSEKYEEAIKTPEKNKDTVINTCNYADNKMITCKLCNYQARDKFNYNKHLNSKKHYEKVEKSASKCEHCSNMFYNKYSMLRHEKICKQKSSSFL